MSAATCGLIVRNAEAKMPTPLRVFRATCGWSRRNGTGDAAPVREGRRMRWLDDVLEPLHGLPDEQKRRLRAALALTLGIDSIVVMKDVCGLDDEESLEVLRWAATALLRAGTARE